MWKMKQFCCLTLILDPSFLGLIMDPSGPVMHTTLFIATWEGLTHTLYWCIIQYLKHLSVNGFPIRLVIVLTSKLSTKFSSIFS
jgi:hypothetical protein